MEQYGLPPTPCFAVKIYPRIGYHCRREDGHEGPHLFGWPTDGEPFDPVGNGRFWFDRTGDDE